MSCDPITTLKHTFLLHVCSGRCCCCSCCCSFHAQIKQTIVTKSTDSAVAMALGSPMNGKFCRQRNDNMCAFDRRRIIKCIQLDVLKDKIQLSENRVHETRKRKFRREGERDCRYILKFWSPSTSCSLCVFIVYYGLFQFQNTLFGCVCLGCLDFVCVAATAAHRQDMDRDIY